MENTPIKLSVGDAITDSFERTKLLILPINFPAWLVVAVTVWLISLGAFLGGGSSIFTSAATIGGAVPGLQQISKQGGTTSGEVTAEISTFLDDSRPAIMMIWLALGIVGLAVFIFLLYFSTHAKFVLMAQVAEGVVEFHRPWKETNKQANSLFGIYALFLVTIFFLANFIILWEYLRFQWSLKENLPLEQIVIVAFWGFFIKFLVISPLIAFLYVFRTISDSFIMAIMYKKKLGVIASWKIFLPLLKSHFLDFALYAIIAFLLKIAYVFSLGTINSFLIFLFCIPIIPVINRLPFVPVDLFFRAMPLYFLGQVSEDLNVVVPTSIDRSNGNLLADN